MVSNFWRPVVRLSAKLLDDLTHLGRAPQRPANTAHRFVAAAPDYAGCPQMSFGRQCPGGYRSGQVVWAWVAYEEDAGQGKDRPVLLVGADANWLLGLPATSQDHDRDADQERRAGRYWVDIGRGDWDARRRPSEVRADRIVRVDPVRVRRAAGRVGPEVFAEVAAAVNRHWDD